MINFILILAIAFVFALALKSSIRHFRGESSCCGRSRDITKKKRLDSPATERKTALITGMKCSSCEEKARNALNKIEGLAVKKTSAKKGLILFEVNRHIPEAEIKTALEKIGFELTSVF